MKCPEAHYLMSDINMFMTLYNKVVFANISNCIIHN